MAETQVICYTCRVLPDETVLTAARAGMVADQLVPRGISDPLVLRAMERVPRHRFLPAALWGEAYADYPLPLAGGQTISQPYIVALMAELLRAGPGARVLEIGLGSGYLAAVLTVMGLRVWAVELLPELARSARRTLAELGLSAQIMVADGYAGWPGAAPFAGIIVSAAPSVVPPALPGQLADGGRLVIPVGVAEQRLLRMMRIGDSFTTEEICGVRFVPLVHATGRRISER